MKVQFILGLIASTFFSLSVSAQKTTITTAELPANAQTFLKKHFPNETPTYIVKEKEIFLQNTKCSFPILPKLNLMAKAIGKK